MINIRPVIAMVFLGISIVVAQAPSAADTAAKAVTAGNFSFSYSIEGENLVGKLSCPATGWVSVGFNSKKGMKNAFFIMAAVVDGKPVITEEFATGMFSHKSITSLGGKNTLVSGDCVALNGVTVLSFTLPLSTKDGMHPELAVGKKVFLLFAAGGSNNLAKKHKTRESIAVTL